MPRQDSRFGPVNSTNYGKSDYASVAEWTWDGNVGASKMLLYFDISSIPQNVKIENAFLSLSVDREMYNKYFTPSKSKALKI